MRTGTGPVMKPTIPAHLHNRPLIWIAVYFNIFFRLGVTRKTHEHSFKIIDGEIMKNKYWVVTYRTCRHIYYTYANLNDSKREYGVQVHSFLDKVCNKVVLFTQSSLSSLVNEHSENELPTISFVYFLQFKKLLK